MPSTKKLDFALAPIYTNGGGGGSNEDPKTPLDKPGGDDTVDAND